MLRIAFVAWHWQSWAIYCDDETKEVRISSKERTFEQQGTRAGGCHSVLTQGQEQHRVPTGSTSIPQSRAESQMWNVRVTRALAAFSCNGPIL